VDGRGVVVLPGPVGDPELDSVHLDGLPVVPKVVPEQVEQGRYPPFAGGTCGRVVFRQTVQPAAENLPEVPGVPVGGRHLVHQRPAGGQAEIGRPLARQLIRLQPL
jgi:hypothetical protein